MFLIFFCLENVTVVDVQVVVQGLEDVGDAAQVNGLQVGHMTMAFAVGQGLNLDLTSG